METKQKGFLAIVLDPTRECLSVTEHDGLYVVAVLYQSDLSGGEPVPKFGDSIGAPEPLAFAVRHGSSRSTG